MDGNGDWLVEIRWWCMVAVVVRMEVGLLFKVVMGRWHKMKLKGGIR